ncbi:MAG: hypothetical protein OQJ84_09505, partial [Xanthomonadales bacterium]|nr:hypothetical protein [Xanthomonadales bacterium]
SYRQYGNGRPLSQVDQLSPKDFDYIAGASLFFPASTLKSGLNQPPGSSAKKSVTGQYWLNEEFFLYFEELDLARRLKPGLGLGWCRDALIKHVGGIGTGAQDNRRSGLAEYHSTLSALKFTHLYYPRRLWAMAPLRYLAKCLLLILTGEFRLIGVMTKAYLDYRSDS